MKAVLISINAYWCDWILKELKTIEVRTTAPKMETPFKCFIYCTKRQAIIDGKKFGYIGIKERYMRERGHVVAWLDEPKDYSRGELPFLYKVYSAHGRVIGEFTCDDILDYDSLLKNHMETLLDREHIDKYRKGKPAYGWHISDLEIYDEPKELSEFGLKRAPQSWQYIEV